MSPKKHPDVVVIGAGAFGGWTAWHLLQRGARVTLVDAWGAGHPRGTSSGESRLIRCGYGLKPLYTEWTVRALRHWKRWQREWRAELFLPSGVLWLCAREDDYVRASLSALRRHKVPHQRLTPRQLTRRFPQFSADGLAFAYFEPRAGFLRAKLATETVARAVAAHPRGHVLLASAVPPAAPADAGGNLWVGASAPTKTGRRGALSALPLALSEVEGKAVAEAEGHSNIFLRDLQCANGARLKADAFVFACGPWLPQLFPDLLGRRIRVTKQEIFFFGLPGADSRFAHPAMKPWIEIHADFYGVPARDGHGFKIARDRAGPVFDPTHGEREPEPEALRAARDYLAHRFPALAGAPLVEANVCQYERTPDSNLVIDRHPRFANVWVAGGGSGHGFKLGPAVGEFVAEQILAAKPRPILPELRLSASAWPEEGPLPVTRSF